MTLRGIIFDHDGTLVDSEGIHFNIWQQLLGEFGVELEKSVYLKHHCGVPTRQNALTLVARHQLPITAQELNRRKDKLLHRHLQSQPFPLRAGAFEAMQQCVNAGLKIGVATGAGQTETLNSLNSHKLAQFVEQITTKEMVANSKPAPDTYLATLQALQLPVQHCIALEDSFTGLSSARAAGLRCVVVDYEFARGQDLSKADFHAENLLQAVDWAINNN